MAAGSIVWELLMNTGSFETDLNRAAKTADKNFKGMQQSASVASQAISGLVAGTLVGFGLGIADSIKDIFHNLNLVEYVRDALDQLDEMSKLAQKTGTTTEAISSLSVAAGLSDISTESLGQGLVKLSKGMSDAARGTGDAQKAFEALGIGVLDANGGLKSADAIMGEVAEKFSGLADGANKTALAVAIFGRAGAEMIPLLNGGAEEMKKLSDEAAQFGLIMDTKTAKAAENFNDNVARVGLAANGLVQTFTAQLIPTIDGLMQSFITGATASGGLVDSLKAMANEAGHDVAEFLAVAAADAKIFWKALTDLNDAVATFNKGTAANSDATMFKDLLRGLGDFQGQLAATGFEIDTIFEGLTRATGGIGAVFDALGLNIEHVFTNAFSHVKDSTISFVNDISKSINQVLEKLNAPTIPMMAGSAGSQKPLYSLADSYAAGADRGGYNPGLGPKLLNAGMYGSAGETGGTPMLPGNKPLAPGIAPNAGASKKQIDEGEKLIDQLERRLALMGDLTEREKLLIEIDHGYTTFKTDQQQQDAIGYATAIDFINEQNKAYTESQASLKALSKVTQDTSDDMSQFAIKAARNIESSLGDGIYNVITGKFDGILSQFGDMLAKMASQAAAAKIGDYLFGNFGNSKQLGGLLGTVISSFSGGISSVGTNAATTGAFSNVSGLSYAPRSFDGGGFTGEGGRLEPAGVVHKGEYVINAASTKRLGVGYLSSLNGYANGGLVGGALPGSGAAPVVQITFNQDGKSEVKNDTPGLEKFGKDIQDMIDKRYKELQMNSLRQGGDMREAVRGGRR
jgi:hypothetical protein